VIAGVGSTEAFAALRVDSDDVDQADVPRAFGGVAAGVQGLFERRRKFLLERDSSGSH